MIRDSGGTSSSGCGKEKSLGFDELRKQVKKIAQDLSSFNAADKEAEPKAITKTKSNTLILASGHLPESRRNTMAES